MDDLDLLRNTMLFRLLDGDELGELITSFERRTYATDSVIFNHGEPGDSLYIVADGEVELFVKDTTGDKIVLETCTRTNLFGELSLLDGGARTATARCISDVRLLVLHRDSLLQFIQHRPEAAMDLLTTMGQRMRTTDALLRRRVTRNINEEMEVRSTLFERAADVIAEFSGSLLFLGLNAGWFALWIGWNTLPGLKPFDPYPFGFLTMVVSLEAIFLSIFVLISQNRQSAKDRLRADADFDVNLKAELEITQLHEKVDFLTEEVLRRMGMRS